jgi:hypothetical protein
MYLEVFLTLYPLLTPLWWDPLGRWPWDKHLGITRHILHWSVFMSHNVEDWSSLTIAHQPILLYAIISSSHSWPLSNKVGPATSWFKCDVNPWIWMTVVTCKCYGIYMTYQLWISWRMVPLAGSGGNRKALSLGTKFGRWVECPWPGSIIGPSLRI